MIREPECIPDYSEARIKNVIAYLRAMGDWSTSEGAELLENLVRELRMRDDGI